MGEWTPRKLEKQRSVTFASIDLLEPIEEDFPQVFDFKFWLLDEISCYRRVECDCKEKYKSS